jgi:hypothetical protein
VTNAKGRRRTNKKDIVSVAHSSSGNAKAIWQEWTKQTDTGCISVGRKIREKEHWATEDPLGRHLQEGSRTVVTNSQK